MCQMQPERQPDLSFYLSVLNLKKELYQETLATLMENFAGRRSLVFYIKSPTQVESSSIM